MQYRKKPIVIEAFQWWSDMGTCGGVELQEANDDYGIVRTLEGAMRAESGDWIITGIKGEIYPCKPDIFEATYDAVDTPPAALPVADDEMAGTIEAALYFLRASGRTEMHGDQLERIDTALTWISQLSGIPQE